MAAWLKLSGNPGRFSERDDLGLTTAPVLDPGRRRTKKGFFWAIASDDRGHSGAEPPIVLFRYAPGRGDVHAERFLQGFQRRYLQCDGDEGYDRLTRLQRAEGPWTLVHCWSHLCRRFIKQMRNTKSPLPRPRPGRSPRSMRLIPLSS